MISSARSAILDEISNSTKRISLDRPTRIGIDGIDGAGKTSFATDLASTFLAIGDTCTVLSVDNFLMPQDHRYRLGRLSPVGLYLDSYDYPALVEVVHSLSASMQPPSFIVVEGIFLHRPEICYLWDISVFLRISFEISMARILQRDVPVKGSREELEDRYRRRFHPAQVAYLHEVRPETLATLTVDNSDVDWPIRVA